MTDIHYYIAFSVPAGFLLMALWALVAFVRNKAPGENFWRLVALMQAILGIQIIVGAILFISGGRPNSNAPEWLHYVYGGLFPLALLVLAHRYGRRTEGIAWIAFGLAGLVIFGLTFRALQTGLGTD
jgi:heme A synthase